MASLVYRDTHNGTALVYRDSLYTAPVGDTTAPDLTAASATATGPTTATGSVTTNEAGGTLFFLASASATATAAQVKAGASQSVTAAGVQAIGLTGLPAATTLYAHYLHRDAASNESVVADSASFTTQAAADTTAPTLSAPTASSNGASGGTGSVTTNEGNGTLYFMASTNATESAATVKAGATQAISSTGVKNVTVASLAASTLYYLHFLHRDAAGNDSTVANTAGFTTAAPADTTGPVMQGAITATKTSTTTDLAWPAATDANGVAEYFVSKDGGAAVSTGTTRSKSFTGLAPLSTHQYEITARDTVGNGSTNSLLVIVTTDADTVDPIPDPPQEMKPVTIAQFRLDFPEFGNPTKYTDAQIRVQLVAASMVLGELQWGDLWGYGVELRTAHFLTIRARNLAAAAAGGVGGAVSGLLTSKAVDKVSASYDVGATTYEGAGFWNTSSYGIEFWQLLMMFGAGPIQL